ncbi:holin-associated N-acetylmuramidase [Psychromarinibacter sp. C21-152]|uniref:Holin-associated N-acetylmuramidase n=1 Tax=Psychromarinibacter sediminicola TaxID=3033385 RepID=A0AAE3NRY6_9RHOB|nr:holin-associated N-acetylmuramidase [Psychromarinibacter sediminicola]MDF0601341.1 holin-associated N-acetylmuramidase [Psychromarinibacter sediminicola]
MKSVEQIADEIIAREGGYVNDPDDPGGATKFGVTIGTLKALRIDNDGDGDTDADDVKLLSREQARDIFVRDYFHRPRIGALPEAIQASVFDMYVNSGANAVRILQRLLNDMGHGVQVDGAIGPETVAAAEAAWHAAPRHLADAYGIARRNFYYSIADRRPSSRKFATRRDGGKGGWIRRAEEFVSPRYHLTEAEHRRRVAQWD